MMMMIVDLYSALRKVPVLRYVSQCIVKRNIFSADRKVSYIWLGVYAALTYLIALSVLRSCRNQCLTNMRSYYNRKHGRLVFIGKI